jgi:hypothetical protein
VTSTDEPWAVKLRDQRNMGDFRHWKKPAEYQQSLDRLLRDLSERRQIAGRPCSNLKAPAAGVTKV